MFSNICNKLCNKLYNKLSNIIKKCLDVENPIPDREYNNFKHNIDLNYNLFPDPGLNRNLFNYINSNINNYIIPKNSVIIFLPSILAGVYDFDDFKVWFSDVIDSINSSKYSNYNIIIKPHPMLKKNIINYVESQIQQYDNVKLVYFNSQLLLKSACLVITSHSAVILDSLAFEIPTLFYHKFSSNWMARHPEKSNFLNIGANYIDSKNQLLEYLNKKKIIRNNTRIDFFAKINHKNSLLKFLRSKNII